VEVATKSDQSKIDYMVANRHSLEEQQCIVIKWRTAKKYKPNYARIDEYVAVCHDLSEKYKLNDEKDILLESALKLIKINIYVGYQFSYQYWVIPNEFKDIQDDVLSRLPDWAEVQRK
jgi:hypothetical protein